MSNKNNSKSYNSKPKREVVEEKKNELPAEVEVEQEETETVAEESEVTTEVEQEHTDTIPEVVPQKIDPVVTFMGKVNVPRLNVRASASIKSAVIEVVNENDILELGETKNPEWYGRFNGGGFVMAKFITR